MKKSVDFGATDAPMHSQDRERARWPIRHIPSVIGALTISFNIKGIDQLKLDGETIAKIYLKQIRNWNDPNIKSLNPKISLPNEEIQVIRRKDKSGSTYILSDFLNASSISWRKKMRVDKSLFWKGSATEVKSNYDMTLAIKSMDFSIGYVELAYALKNDLKIAKIKNRNGKFILPTIQTMTAAAGNYQKYTDAEITRSIVYAPGKIAYPISAFTYFIMPEKDQDNPSLKEFKKVSFLGIKQGTIAGTSITLCSIAKIIK